MSLLKHTTYITLKEKEPLKQTKNIKLQSVNGEQIQTKGTARIPFKIGKLKLEYTFHIVDQINRCCILGRDWLVDNGVRLYYDINKLRIKGIYVDLEQDIHIASILRAQQTLTLEPNSVIITHSKLKPTDYFKPGDPLIIKENELPDKKENINDLYDEETPIIIDSIATISENRTIPVVLANISTQKIIIKKDTPIARCKIRPQIAMTSVNENNTMTTEDITQHITNNLDCEDHHRKWVTELLMANSDVIAKCDSDLGRTSTIVMDVKTGETEPIHVPQYRIPLKHRPFVEQTVNELLEAKIIEPSLSRWNSPIVIAKKKDGLRFCLDLRKLNQVTQTEKYRLPVIDDLLGILDKAKFISSLDLKSGYWSIPLTDDSKLKTSFTCHLGAYLFNSVPFGLKNAGSVFMKLMDEVLRGYNDFCACYLDDIVLFSRTLEEHKTHITKVLDRLRQHKLKIKLKKCSFVKKETKYLGFVISTEGIKPDPNKVKAIKKLPRPTNLKSTRSYLGCYNYYRRYLPNFATIAEPIVALTRKGTKFRWSEKCETAFNTLKKKLAEVTMLGHADPNKPYLLYCDSSSYAIAACLSQSDTNTGEFIRGVTGEKPIYFLSKKLSPTQQNWPIIEKEFYAIFYAITKLDFYLHNSKITVFTDHQPLKHVMTSKMQNRKIRNWALSIEGYDIEMNYLSGKLNIISDLLSREVPLSDQSSSDSLSDIHENTYETSHNTINEKETQKTTMQQTNSSVAINTVQLPSNRESFDKPSASINIINSNVIPSHNNKFNERPPANQNIEIDINDPQTADAQKSDPVIQKLKQQLMTGTADLAKQKQFIIVDNTLYFISEQNDDLQLRMYVPNTFQQKILTQFHDNLGHPGVDRMYYNIKTKYYWPKMFHNIYEHVQKCITCQERNLLNIRAPMQQTDIPMHPFEKISVDTAGPFPKTLSGSVYVLHFIDHFSLWPESFPVPDKTGQRVAQILIDEIIPRYATPRILLTDNGTEFVNQAFEETLKELNIKHITTTFHRPQSNAKNERAHRTINDIIAKMSSDDSQTWDINLNQALAAVRFNINTSTMFSPFYLLYGRSPIFPLDNILKPRTKYNGDDLHKMRLQEMHRNFYQMYANVRKMQYKNMLYFNKNAKYVDFKIGDHVYYKNFNRKTKLDKKWLAHYIIIEQKSPVSFIIKHQLTNKTTKAHASQLRKTYAPWDEMTSKNIHKPTQNKRHTTYVTKPISDSDETDESSSERNPNIDKRLTASSSSDESDLPLAIIRNRIRERNERLNSQRHTENNNYNINTNNYDDTNNLNQQHDFPLGCPTTRRRNSH